MAGSTVTGAKWSYHGQTDASSNPDDVSFAQAHKYLQVVADDSNTVDIWCVLATGPSDTTDTLAVGGQGTVRLKPGKWFKFKDDSGSMTNASGQNVSAPKSRVKLLGDAGAAKYAIYGLSE